MAKVWLEKLSKTNENGIINGSELPLQSMLLLFAAHCCEDSIVEFHVTSNDSDNKGTSVSKHAIFFNSSLIAASATQELQCSLPAVEKTQVHYISGFCKVLRYLLQDSKYLGFRRSSLAACAEVSEWTKFCERYFINATERLLRQDVAVVDVPPELWRLERHLSSPLRMHNIGKLMHNIKISNTQNVTTAFLEGLEITLADLIIFPCLHLMLANLKALPYLSNVFSYYERVWTNPDIRRASAIFNWEMVHRSGVAVLSFDGLRNEKFIPFRVKAKRRRCKRETLTRQLDIDLALENAKASRLKILEIETEFYDQLSHESEGIEVGLPTGYDVPLSRLARKQNQLLSIMAIVAKMAKDRDTIVDFCSGGGHLGILIASYLPRCDVILVENKSESVARALQRIEQLHLTNIRIFECNLEYFIGDFDLGVSLHACGTSTDLVMKKCGEKGASFVCCPCCYGGISNVDQLDYPRSKQFKQPPFTFKDYMCLAHSSDQTHAHGPKLSQGDLCAQYIDSDRLSWAMENGYEVNLTKLKPFTCCLKNNILVGRKFKQSL